jgi:hypothetical protein
VAVATTRVVKLLADVPRQAAMASPRHLTMTEVSESCCKNKREVVASVPVQTVLAAGVLVAVTAASPPQALKRAATDAAKVICRMFIWEAPFVNQWVKCHRLLTTSTVARKFKKLVIGASFNSVTDRTDVL